MNRNGIDPVEQRREYVTGFNDLMLKIWKEQISKFGAIDTATLYRSVLCKTSQFDGKVIDVMLAYNFVEYGIYVDRGTGRKVPGQNPGDIGRAKVRQARPWFSKKWFRSFINIRNFFADSLGEEFCAVIPRVLGSTEL